jgi:hypothetical protein
MWRKLSAYVRHDIDECERCYSIIRRAEIGEADPKLALLKFDDLVVIASGMEK